MGGAYFLLSAVLLEGIITIIFWTEAARSEEEDWDFKECL